MTYKTLLPGSKVLPGSDMVGKLLPGSIILPGSRRKVLPGSNVLPGSITETKYYQVVMYYLVVCTTW